MYENTKQAHKKNPKGPKEIIMEYIHLQKFKQPINIMIVLHYDKYQKKWESKTNDCNKMIKHT